MQCWSGWGFGVCPLHRDPGCGSTHMLWVPCGFPEKNPEDEGLRTHTRPTSAKHLDGLQVSGWGRRGRYGVCCSHYHVSDAGQEAAGSRGGKQAVPSPGTWRQPSLKGVELSLLLSCLPCSLFIASFHAQKKRKQVIDYNEINRRGRLGGACQPLLCLDSGSWRWA